MAKSNAVWGIDIGQCALKALRCRPHEKDPQQIVVESYDYIEYPKILTQPEADPAELIREALEQFLSRNELGSDGVAISVPGQNGLSRFIKLPPVESKKIPDIVKYEARQQIPFALEDVVWDYQQLTGGSEEDGFALEPEVGLFAMKRDQVTRALQPMEDAGIEVDFIQLAPLSVFNYVCFDRLEDLHTSTFDPADPPESKVVISLGTDTTDLVITNGFRVWQRNIPIGGNHFTRSLSKELKLTFVKAEHLKRNATQADNPKAVFQAMRPVFSDLLAEIQRSLGYFMSLDRSAKIGEVISLGNAMKLPGLQRYLTQNLEQEVKPVDQFSRLSGGSATSGAQFKDNILSFAVAYGLCIQGLGKAEIHTNLLPEEMVRKRLIRAKKPWAVAGAAAVLLGLTLNYFTHVSAWQETETDDMGKAMSNADRVSQVASGHTQRRSEIHQAFDTIEETGASLVSNVEGRLVWLELLKAVDAALPHDERPAEQRKETAEDISARNELHFSSLDQQHFEDLEGDWFTAVEENYWEARGGRPGENDAESEDLDELDDESLEEEEVSLSGPGWVIQLTGYHYHNEEPNNASARFVNNTIIRALEENSVLLPDGPNGELVEVPLADMGISHPWLLTKRKLVNDEIDSEASLSGRAGRGRMQEFGEGSRGNSRRTGEDGGGKEDPDSRYITLRRYDFIIQFCWQPQMQSQRRERAEQRRQQAQLEAEETAATSESDDPIVR